VSRCTLPGCAGCRHRHHRHSYAPLSHIMHPCHTLCTPVTHYAPLSHIMHPCHTTVHSGRSVMHASHVAMSHRYKAVHLSDTGVHPSYMAVHPGSSLPGAQLASSGLHTDLSAVLQLYPRVCTGAWMHQCAPCRAALLAGAGKGGHVSEALPVLPPKSCPAPPACKNHSFFH